MENKNVIEFYDNFVEGQKESGINARIYSLYHRLLKLGLNSHSNILEFGCGIGAMTFLLSKTVKQGRIEAVDLSPESIEYAKKRIKPQNINFHAGDVVKHIPVIKEIDYVTLFDVIEHIPLELHAELFQNLSKICYAKTKILINIPNPQYIEYDILNNANSLQIIDQPVPLALILKNLDDNGLELVYFETYSIWVEDDYQFFEIRKKKDFKEINIAGKRNWVQKALNKLQRNYVKIKYNYR